MKCSHKLLTFGTVNESDPISLSFSDSFNLKT
jgi:hypothetical protein